MILDAKTIAVQMMAVSLPESMPRWGDRYFARTLRDCELVDPSVVCAPTMNCPPEFLLEGGAALVIYATEDSVVEKPPRRFWNFRRCERARAVRAAPLEEVVR